MRNLLFLVFAFAWQILFGQLPTNFVHKGIGGGGALFCPSINPSNPSEIYMGCDMSQLYHSTNSGSSWDLVPFKKHQGGHYSEVRFTNNPQLLLAVDYSSINGVDRVFPTKSIDGGNSWTEIIVSGASGDCYHLSCDYNNPNRIVVGYYGEIWFSGNGSSFTKIHTCISNGSGNHIAGVFYEGNNIYIGTNDGIIYSNNGGSSFQTLSTNGIPTGQYILSFAAAKQSDTTRFFCLTASSVWAGYQYGSGYYNTVKGIYSMDNQSGTWKSKISGINTISDFPVFVGMAENDISTIYLAGGSAGGSPIIIKSMDAGTSWSHVFKTTNNQNIATGWAGSNNDKGWSFPEAPFGFTVCKSNSSIVMFTDYSGAHITYNAGINWKQQYVDTSTENAAGTSATKKAYKSCGLDNTTNWQVLWLDSQKVFAAFSDINGVVSSDKGNTWKFIPNLTQNSVYRIVKHKNGNLYAATSNIHDMYQTTRIYDAQIDAGTGGISFSSDGGNSFQVLKNFNHPIVWIALDPTDSNRMYASVLHSTQGGIFVTNNLNAGAAATWTKTTSPPRTMGHPFVIEVLNDGSIVASFSARKPNSSSPFTNSSGVFFSNNQGASWSDRSHNNMQFYTKDVVIDPNDPTQSTWYVSVFSAWGSGIPANSGGLYKTTDKGINWIKISSPNSSYRVNSCTIKPGNSNEIYYTTETDGLWFSSNASAGAASFALVSSYPFRHPVRVFYNPFNPAEIWVSAFGAGMRVGSPNNSAHIIMPTEETISVFPNPASHYITLESLASACSTQIFDISGKQWQHFVDNKKIDVSGLTDGIYFIRIVLPDKVIIKKFIKN